MKESVFVAPCDPDHPDALVLVDELSSLLMRITGDSGRSSFSAADVRGERARFLVARDERGQLLGCGAVRLLENDVAEIKRMYARPGSRGVGATLLKELEAAAAELGYNAICLATRRVNTQAVAFYQKHGYAVIPGYGRYISLDDSICLARLCKPKQVELKKLRHASRPVAERHRGALRRSMLVPKSPTCCRICVTGRENTSLIRDEASPDSIAYENAAASSNALRVSNAMSMRSAVLLS